MVSKKSQKAQRQRKRLGLLDIKRWLTSPKTRKRFKRLTKVIRRV